MSIAKHKEVRFVVECDNCGLKSHHLYEAPTDPSETYADALNRGWYSDELIDLCSSCEHKTVPHWSSCGDAMDAAVVEATNAMALFRWVVYRCPRCRFWTYRTEDFNA